ncbi:mannose-1-phosphate guanylyltransferase [Plebeiibacterium sediminum]|uniref:mannose-1-phosphate guanylyltransferase n=1 Tax=Plebeiibacterium sediminum TaxID=2992112 RepID=A0AAE3SGY6_9BACT|nr:mannose-1-phosphate guanylyltransferase [Plebeiobacterium sediminum]MCW3788612.1 mannose-1-phosphate guanylyltransferase [Plebeiobacterium sediminum]
MKTSSRYCVIMAGGIGSRFWPLSRQETPKQFLDILGTGRTLIQQTFDRFSSICPPENFLVVTSIEYKDIVLEQLPLLKPNQVLTEPFRRNTAPCIAYANSWIKKRNPDASIIVTPADHLILKQTEFETTILKGIDFVENQDALLTIGLKPHRPETGYGYIQVNDDTSKTLGEIEPVKTFTEKPNLELAKIFFESGEFFWNSGIFLWKLSSISNAFDCHLQDIQQLFNSIEDKIDTVDEQESIKNIYVDCKNISIDYGIMEKANNVFVLTAEVGWSDLGTWSSLYEHSSKDNNNNAINTGKVLTYESSNCIVNLPHNTKAIIQGLNDYIIAESNNCLLICPKSNEQQIRQFTADIANQFPDE